VAPVAYTLWQRFLRFDPGDPVWANPDQFVLSEGHASALPWSLLHLSGVQAVERRVYPEPDPDRRHRGDMHHELETPN
jgi:transketolase